MTVLEKDILNILQEDARISPKKIAAALSVTEEEVKVCLANMEQSGVLVKYTAIINSEKAEDALVEALIEVKVTRKRRKASTGLQSKSLLSPR